MKAEEIQDLLDENYKKFIGTNEAEINFCTEIENEFNKKQSEIDELVAYLKNYNHLAKSEINELIQKHTKK